MQTHEAPPRRVLVPVERAELTEPAVDKLAELAQQMPLSIELLHIWEPLPFTPPEASYFTEGQLVSYREAAEARGQAALAAVKAYAEKVGLQLDVQLIESGEPAEAILRVADERNVDWIVMPSHQRRGISRWFLGSVAARVAAASSRPVLLVPSHPEG